MRWSRGSVPNLTILWFYEAHWCQMHRYLLRFYLHTEPPLHLISWWLSSGSASGRAQLLPGLETALLHGLLRTLWSHLTSNPELFALRKQQWVNLGLSLFTFWGCGKEVAFLLAHLPSNFPPAAQGWWGRAGSACPHCHGQQLCLPQSSVNSKHLQTPT